MPPASAAQGLTLHTDRGLGLGQLLAADYERKKQKLQQELQLDHKHFVDKKKDLKTSEPLQQQPQNFFLCFDERVSFKEKLKEERNKEYNFFLQQRAQIGKLKKGTPVAYKPGQGDHTCITSPVSPPILNYTHPLLGDAAKRDAATLTEGVHDGKSRRGLGQKGRRHWRNYRLKDLYSSEEELDSDMEEKLRCRRWQDSPSVEYKEERRANRVHLDIKEAEPPGDHDQNNNDRMWSSPQTPDRMKTAARSRPATSKDEAMFATGLLIGSTEEQEASQMRKERYKQELLKQIAEQRRNKMKEKELELIVAATGATDPEKEPDRIKRFGAAKRHYDSRGRRDLPYKPGIDIEAARMYSNTLAKTDKDNTVPPGTSQVADTGRMLPGGPQDASLGYINEDYHRDFSSILVTRGAGAPPPLPIPPVVTNTYKTPYDAAYYYCGTRDPLDPHLPPHQTGVPGVVQQAGNFPNPYKRTPSVRPSRRAESTDHHRGTLVVAGEPAEKSVQRSEIAKSYQEALRQQIKEREERKRRQKEEEEQHEAKILEEMMEYNPWGRSGGGAPIKDQKGNLVSDLNHMHRINEESYRNPGSRSDRQTPKYITNKRDSPPSHQTSGFSDVPAPQQQLQMQDSYKEALRQQIEDNRRKQAEERERLRIEEEKDERRVAEQRARIQQEYEEEQRRLKGIGHRLDPWIHEDKTHRLEEKKKVREEQEIQKRVTESSREQKPTMNERGLEHQNCIHEDKTQHQQERNRVTEGEEIQRNMPESRRVTEEREMKNERAPSPPIPTLQRKQIHPMTSRPSSGLSQVSFRTERSISTPHFRTATTQQLQDGQQEVIRELSTLRRFLRKEERKLAAQLEQTHRQLTHYTPPPDTLRTRQLPKVEEFDSLKKQTDQRSARSGSSAAAHVNMENIREFNQLKNRDTASREEVRHIFPDPPTDARSLDIQQKALLRQQLRKIRRMKRGGDRDDALSSSTEFLNPPLPCYHPPPRDNMRGHIHRDSILPSENAFFDVYSGDPPGEAVYRQRSPQTSAGHQDQRGGEAATTPNCESGERSIMRCESLSGDLRCRSEGPSVDEVDVLSLRSALERRVSLETIATEAWLRPGTSDAVKRSGCREKPEGGRETPPWLTQRLI
ncbi:centrosome and spindle pole-associated protein 1 [Aulostomus maculatus]